MGKIECNYTCDYFFKVLLVYVLSIMFGLTEIAGIHIFIGSGSCL